MNPTPHNAQPPQWRKITKEDPPQFPCWLWGKTSFGDGSNYHAVRFERDPAEIMPTVYSNGHATHWHPDQPTAPEGEPKETVSHPTLRPTRHPLSEPGYTEDCRCSGAVAPASPAETDTPTPETDGDCVKRINEGSQDWVRADFARRLERERDQARAQLKSMNDQFLAVSEQLGEAKALIASLQYKRDETYTALRSENKALREDSERTQRLLKTISFFASVIRSGESWTATCQKELDSAMRPAQPERGQGEGTT